MNFSLCNVLYITLLFWDLLIGLKPFSDERSHQFSAKRAFALFVVDSMERVMSRP